MAADIAINQPQGPVAAAALPGGHAMMVRQKPQADDDTMEIPVLGKFRGWSRIERFSLSYTMVLGGFLFVGAAGVWGANHYADPKIKQSLEIEKIESDARVRQMDALTNSINALAVQLVKQDAELRGDNLQLREVIANVNVTLREVRDELKLIRGR